MWRILLTICLLCWSADAEVREVRCRNEKDEPVDWYIMYKAPGLQEIYTNGLEYIYIDSIGKKKQTSTDHNKLIDDPKGVLANTLKPIFKLTKDMPADFGFISYSDQPPNGTAVGSMYGHSKGVVMMDKTNTGVWLLHSTPKFPFKTDNNFWPPSGVVNAQTFICVTFKYEEFKKIGQHLLNIRAFPFDHQIPNGFLKELIDVTVKKRSPGHRIQELTSAGGEASFRSIAKELYEYKKPTTTSTTTRQDTLKDSKRFDGDLYRTIAETYSTIKKSNIDVRVQTWGQQCYREGSYCEQNQHQVINIKSVKADLGKENDKWEVEWEPCNDHSKWCVAKDNNNLICIADVNRAVTQYERPGGALCFEHQQASDLFKGLIAGTKDCPSPTPLKHHHLSPDLTQYYASKKAKPDPGSACDDASDY